MSKAAAKDAFRAAIEVTPVPGRAFVPGPGQAPTPSLPLWTSKVDSSVAPAPDPHVEGAVEWRAPSDAALVRVAPPGKNPADPRQMTTTLPAAIPGRFGEMVAVVMAHPDRIAPGTYLWELIRAEPNRPYSVRVFLEDDWRRLSVTGALPFDATGASIFPATSNADELWPGILSKVVAMLEAEPLQYLAGLAVVRGEAPPSGFFAEALHELPNGRRVFDLSKFPVPAATHSVAWADTTKQFSQDAEIMLAVKPASQQNVVLLSIDPKRNAAGRPWFRCSVRHVQSWSPIVRSTVAQFEGTDGLHHQLLTLAPGLYSIKVATECGFKIQARSETDSLILDDAQGRAWQSEPFRLQVANASGKHNGSDAPGMFATYFNCDLVVDTATRALFQIAFDDRRVPFTAELLSAALASPINVVLSPAVQIPPGTYRLQAGGRAGDSEGGVAPGAFSVRVISEAGIKLAVSAKASSVTKTFADTFQRAYLDRRVFRENISTTSKEPVSVSVDVLVTPPDTAIAVSVDDKLSRLGIGRVVFPAVTITPGQKVVVACRTDLDVTWSRWQIRVQPADTIQLSPNTEWKDKLDALKQQWQQNDPGRPDRAIATRSTFVNRDPSVDPPPMKDGTAIPPADHVLDPVDVQYSKDLETLSAAAKRNSEEIFQHWKAFNGEVAAKRDTYRNTIVGYENLLDALRTSLEEGDTDAVLAAIAATLSGVPSWKLGVDVYHAYETCYGLQKMAIQAAIDSGDFDEMKQAVTTSCNLLSKVPRLEGGICDEVVAIQAQAMKGVWEDAAKALVDALAEDPRSADTVRDALSDERLSDVDTGKFVPESVLKVVSDARSWLATVQ
ncbi:Calpain catalytic domain-containing protein [Plasmodiophora brassicae]